MLKILPSLRHQLQIETDQTTLSLVREHFSVPNKVFRRGKGYVPDRLYAITPSGKFDSGLFHNVVAYLQANQITHLIEKTVKEKAENGFSHPLIHRFDIEYRDYQEKALTMALRRGKGVVVIPTAGGKTLVMAGLIESIRKTLNDPSAMAMVLVPSIQLVEQTASDFEHYGMKGVTKWSGKNKPDMNLPTIVAGNQILLSKNTDLSILANVKILIVDECLRKNTLISTDKGEKKIQDVRVGDLVKSFNSKTQQIEFKPVLKLWRNLPKSNACDEFLEIVLENGNRVQLTPNHKVYTVKGYKRADELTVDDDVIFIQSSKTMNLRCKYLYAKTNYQTFVSNLWRRLQICFKTFKIQAPRNNANRIL